MISNLFWIVPVASVLALVFAFIFYKTMMKESEGTDRMKEIALDAPPAPKMTALFPFGSTPLSSSTCINPVASVL